MTTRNNNAKLIRRNILARMAKIALENQDLRELDKIPLKMRPRNGASSRCCIYRDRALIKFKTMAIMGFDANSDEDELTSLSTFYKASLKQDTHESPTLRVVDEACSACQRNNYIVTNMCQGCVGRPCMLNCPKDAIHFDGNKAKISPSGCANCGICQDVCPFHAIIYSPVPCEEACPVGAIQKDEDGKEDIDMEKCILCGKCMDACPFGAIVEKSHLFKTLEEIQQNKDVVAMVAPSIAGQFKEPMGKILSALYKLGFKAVVEVAEGAETTTRLEAAELVEKLEEGHSMTTSCCPAYKNLVQKHQPELLHFVSTTLSPMEYTGIECRKRYPGAKLVFLSPCVGKKDEASRSANVDYVVNFEEMASWLEAAEINVSACENVFVDAEISTFSRDYARSGGVFRAVADKVQHIQFESLQIDGIDKRTGKKLKALLNGKKPLFAEVMACQGGCVGGCNTITDNGLAGRQLNKFLESFMEKV